MTRQKRWRNGGGGSAARPAPAKVVNIRLILRFRRMAALVSTFLRGRSVDEALALTGVKPLAAVVSAFARALPLAAVPAYAFDGGLHRAAR